MANIEAINCPKCGAPLPIEYAIDNLCICFYCNSRINFSLETNGQISAKINDKAVDLITERVYLEKLISQEKLLDSETSQLFEKYQQEVLRKDKSKESENVILLKEKHVQADERRRAITKIKRRVEENIKKLEFDIVFARENPSLASISDFSVVIINSEKGLGYFHDGLMNLITNRLEDYEISKNLNNLKKSISPKDYKDELEAFGILLRSINLSIPLVALDNVSAYFAQNIKLKLADYGLAIEMIPTGSSEIGNLPRLNEIVSMYREICDTEILKKCDNVILRKGFMKNEKGIFNVHIGYFEFTSNKQNIVISFSDITNDLVEGKKLDIITPLNTYQFDFSTDPFFLRTYLNLYKKIIATKI